MKILGHKLTPYVIKNGCILNATRIAYSTDVSFWQFMCGSMTVEIQKTIAPGALEHVDIGTYNHTVDNMAWMFTEWMRER